MPTETREQAIERFNQLVKGIRVAMLTTVDEDGSLHSRPMATQRHTSHDGVLWFFTSAGSHTVSEVQHERHVNVAWASLEDNRYVSVSGLGRLVRDREKASELWSPMLKAWFPEGPDTSGLMLLRVEISMAEYWDSASSRMVTLEGLVPPPEFGEQPAPH